MSLWWQYGSQTTGCCSVIGYLIITSPVWLISGICLFASPESSINSNGAAANGDVEAGGGGGGGGKTGKLSSGAWCVCRWLISCMKKDEPAVGATTFQNTTPSTPPVRGEGELVLSLHLSYVVFFFLIHSLFSQFLSNSTTIDWTQTPPTVTKGTDWQEEMRCDWPRRDLSP